MIISKKNKGRNKGIPKSDSHIKKMIENNARAKKSLLAVKYTAVVRKLNYIRA